VSKFVSISSAGQRVRTDTVDCVAHHQGIRGSAAVDVPGDARDESGFRRRQICRRVGDFSKLTVATDGGQAAHMVGESACFGVHVGAGGAGLNVVDGNAAGPELRARARVSPRLPLWSWRKPKGRRRGPGQRSNFSIGNDSVESTYATPALSTRMSTRPGLRRSRRPQTPMASTSLPANPLG
jgi:hypothetical protein